MHPTAPIWRAIKFSIKTHEIYQKQKRKGKDIPYITHPLTVGIILAAAGAAEDVIIAGILHDTIEDSTIIKKVDRKMLVARFGEKVADLVESVTESNKKATWDERKAEAINHIKHFSHGSLLVKSADVISNVSEILDDHQRDGDKVFQRFHAPKEKIIKHYSEAIAAILARWPEVPLKDDLKLLASRMQDIK